LAAKNNSRPFKVKRSGIQGRGAFATRRIRPGQRIIEYKGERIDDKEIERRYDDDAMERHHTFLFGVEDNVTIDATRRGSQAKYINHSCDPNCEAVLDEGRVYIEAIRNIQPGVELCYDYGFEYEGRLTNAMREQYPCRCGSANCRGTILKPRTKRRRK